MLCKSFIYNTAYKLTVGLSFIPYVLTHLFTCHITHTSSADSKQSLIMYPVLVYLLEPCFTTYKEYVSFKTTTSTVIKENQTEPGELTHDNLLVAATPSHLLADFVIPVYNVGFSSC